MSAKCQCFWGKLKKFSEWLRCHCLLTLKIIFPCSNDIRNIFIAFHHKLKAPGDVNTPQSTCFWWNSLHELTFAPSIEEMFSFRRYVTSCLSSESFPVGYNVFGWRYRSTTTRHRTSPRKNIRGTYKFVNLIADFIACMGGLQGNNNETVKLIEKHFERQQKK